MLAFHLRLRRLKCALRDRFRSTTGTVHEYNREHKSNEDDEVLFHLAFRVTLHITPVSGNG